MERPHRPDSNLPERRSLLRRLVGRRTTVRRKPAIRRPAFEVAADPRKSPLVVVACKECGFDYEVTKVTFDDGRAGAIWSCACGSRYIPPGGGDFFSLVRP